MPNIHGGSTGRRRARRNALATTLTTLVTTAALAGAGHPAVADANTPPDVPSQLTVDWKPCADGFTVGNTTPVLTAELTDSDAVPPYVAQVRATFAWWPVNQPTQRTESTTLHAKAAPAVFQYQVQAGAFVDGGTYAFQVRATDSTGAISAWSAECRFTVDVTAPAHPTVGSTDYPDDGGWHGGPGLPGQFTLTANDTTDTIGFWYGLSSGPATYVALDQPGGSTTVTVTPTESGPKALVVTAVDRAGNRSSATTHEFRVTDTSPTVTDGSPTAGYGQPRTLTFAPQMAGVVEYTYRLNDEPEQTVAATADGTSTVTITPTKPGYNDVYVRSRTADDVPSGERRYRFYLATKPTVTSVEYPLGRTGAPAGTPGTFVFRPGMTGVVEYVYSFDSQPAQTIAAGADGSASVTWTPTTAGPHRITVHTVTAAGIQSEALIGAFAVARRT
ncbi:hypothetical protein [Micromonospora sp. NPDC047074]|uniref:hypothetical protein n=1 Tax=Micromonospora sp. NPDC047074 TaxID=3154339 RepID=UPI0033C55936